MAWQTPKTNWQPTDYISYDDYNRIAGNLMYLVKLGNKIGYPIPTQTLDNHKTEDDLPYPSVWNALENSVETINSDTFSFDIGETKTFVTNQSYIAYEELNRLESGILRLYKQLVVQRDTVMHYPQQYNGSSIYKVARIHYADHEPMAYRLNFRLGSRKGVI